VLALLVRGLLNKQAAFELGITEYTVQVHRAHVMRKMEADSFAMLVRLAAKFRLEPRGVEQDSEKDALLDSVHNPDSAFTPHGT
jgi:hypothetical protein